MVIQTLSPGSSNDLESQAHFDLQPVKIVEEFLIVYGLRRVRLCEYLGNAPVYKAYDAIPIGSVLVMIGDDGMSKYDYSDPANIIRISHIGVTGK